MTVADLIEKLKQFPQDLPVQYLDFEQGNTDVECVETDYDHYRVVKVPSPPASPTCVFLS